MNPRAQRGAGAAALVAVLLLSTLPLSHPGTVRGGVPRLEGRSVEENVRASVPRSGPAVPAATWYNVNVGLGAASLLRGAPTPGLPGAAASPAMATDPNASLTLRFGGLDSRGNPTSETWAYNSSPGAGPAVWTNETRPADSPPALEGASMVYDPDVNEFVLFGGSTLRFLTNYTWVYNLTTGGWTNDTRSACALACPSARSGASMAFANDIADDAVILFGGSGDHGALNDTWALATSPSGLIWQSVPTTAAPSPRFDSAFAATQGGFGQRLVLYGGAEPVGSFAGVYQYLSDTWEFFGGRWTNLSAGSTLGGGSPGPLAGGSAVYDSSISTMILVAGENSTLGPDSATWALACNDSFDCTWSLLDPYGPPVSSAGISSDTTSGVPVLYGGFLPNGSASATTWVLQNLTTPSVSLSQTALELGVPIELNASLAGGAGVGGRADGLFELWTLRAPNGTESRIATSAVETSASLTAPGVWQINGTALDDSDVTASHVWNVSVDLPSLRVNASPRASDVGLRINFTAALAPSATDFAAPFNYGWLFGDGQAGSAADESHAFGTAGTYSAEAQLTDGLGNHAESIISVTISDRPTVHIAATSTALPTGGALQLEAELEGGTAPFTYRWTAFGPGANGSGVALGDGPTSTVNFSRPGAWVVELNLTDAVGISAAATEGLHVYGALVASASANVSASPAGSSIAFRANASGGTGGTSFQWAFGDGDFASGASVTHAYGSAGAYTASVWVNDSSGASRQVTLNITVSGSGGTPAVAAGPAFPWLLAAAGIAIVWALAAVVGRALARRSIDEAAAPGSGGALAFEESPPEEPGSADPPGPR